MAPKSVNPPELSPLAVLAQAMGGQTAFAKVCGVDRTTVYRWLNGDTRPSLLEQRAINQLAYERGLTLPFKQKRIRG